MLNCINGEYTKHQSNKDGLIVSRFHFLIVENLLIHLEFKRS